MNKITAIQDRLDSCASEALETLIENVERNEGVRATDIHVALVPHEDPAQVAVDVSITLAPVPLKPHSCHRPKSARTT